jgi:hypothetical protein
LVAAARALIRAALYYEATGDAQLAALFPASFSADLTSLLSQLLADRLPAWRDAASRSLVRGQRARPPACPQHVHPLTVDGLP